MNVNWDEVFRQQPVLETGRCQLRPVTVDDIPHIFRLMGDPKVTKYLGRHPLDTLEDAVATVEKYITQFEEQRGMVWTIINRDHQTFMGTCLLFGLIKAHYRAEIGYALLPDAWGKGIMSEVLPIVIDFAFTSMHLHSLFGQIDPANDASRHLLEKFGFVQEAYFREDFYHPVKQAFTDTAILCLIKPDWQKRKTQSP